MTKKEYLTLFLEKAKEVWEPARGFLVLLRYDMLQDDQIEGLFTLFKATVDTMASDKRKYKLQRATAFANQLRSRADNTNVQELEQGLDAILSEQ